MMRTACIQIHNFSVNIDIFLKKILVINSAAADLLCVLLQTESILFKISAHKMGQFYLA